MDGTGPRAGVLAVAAALLILLQSLPAQAGQRLNLVERAIHESVVQRTEGTDAVGDLLVFANPVFDAANKIEVGHDQGYCVRTVPGRSWECFWTLILKEGLITVEGPYYDRGDSTFVVTGGSGRYNGVKGSLKLHPRDAKGSAYDFHYDLE